MRVLNVFLILMIFSMGLIALIPEKAEATATIITTPAELQAINNDVTGSYELGNDIDMTGVEDFVPIGYDGVDAFTGSFDGKGYVISNLTIDAIDLRNNHSIGDGAAGLFAFVDTGVVIQNVILTNATIIGDWVAGGIVAWVYDSIVGNYTIYRCSVSGSISATGSIWSRSVMRQAVFVAGGILGTSWGLNGASTFTIQECYSTATITGSEPDGSVTRWYPGTYYLGGLIGQIDTSYLNTVIIKDCYSTGNIIDASSEPEDSASMGGFIGWMQVAQFSSITITNCYSTGSVPTTGLPLYCGGFIGQIDYDYENAVMTFSSCYWDTETSNWDTWGNPYLRNGGAYGTLIGAPTGKTTAEMQTQSTFTGWDFTTIWGIDSGGYPYLRWTIPEAPISSSSDFPVTRSLTMILPVVLVSLLILGSIRMALGGQMDVVMLILMGITALLVIVGADVIAGMIAGW